MLYYCKKCGRIVIHHDKIEMEYNCDLCKSLLYKVPVDLYESDLDFVGNNNVKAQKLREELVKTSPEFDQYLFDHRDEILAKRSAEIDAAMERGKAILEGKEKGNKFGVECPYCHATNVSKITVTSKAVHTAIFGIFSMGRNSKQWHCNNCNSDF